MPPARIKPLLERERRALLHPAFKLSNRHEHLAATPPDNRPEVWFLTDPGSYLRPIVIDPEAEIWER